MATEALIGLGTIVEVNTTGTTWFKIGEVTSITPPNESVDEIDVTHMESPGRTREFIQGLIDAGEMSIDINWVPGGDTDEYILAWRTAGTTRPVRITYPTGARDTFPAFVRGYTPSAAAADKLSATVTLRVAGAVVRSTAT